MNEKQRKPQAFWRMCLVALICMLSSTLYAQNITVTGTVKDPMGEPVIGASVSVQGTRAGTVTNIDADIIPSNVRRKPRSYSRILVSKPRVLP